VSIFFSFLLSLSLEWRRSNTQWPVLQKKKKQKKTLNGVSMILGRSAYIPFDFNSNQQS